jgi:hypothetical protein
MWATARVSLNLEEDEFWRMSFDQWAFLVYEKNESLKIKDAFNARVCNTIRAFAPFKKKSSGTEIDFRFFRDPETDQVKSKFMAFMTRHNASNEQD